MSSKTIRATAEKIADAWNISNAETRAALAEFATMKSGKKKYKRFSSFAEILEEARNEEYCPLESV